MGFKNKYFDSVLIDGVEYCLEGSDKGGAESVYDLKEKNTRNICKYIIKIHTKPFDGERFENEINFLKNSKDKGIIDLIQEGSIQYNNPSNPELNGSYRYYIMPKMAMNYRELIDKMIPFDERVKYFLQLCKAVEYLHKKGIIHRDLKPDNALYDEENRQIKVCDFGAAKFPDINITTQGKRLANANYCAPEQRMKNGVVGKYTDIYALGLILNEIFTGTLINGKDYKRIVDIAPSYAELDEIVGKMIVYDWKKRESDITAVIYKIKKIIRVRNYKKNEYVKLALNGSRRQKDRIIANTFAEDCVAMQCLVGNKTLFGSAYFNYHMNIRCKIISIPVRDELKLAAMYNITKEMFSYESETKDIEDSFNYSLWQGREKKSNHIFLGIIDNFKYLKMPQYGEAIHLFAGLKDYHKAEVIEKIRNKFKELEDHFNDSPIVFMCQLIVELLPETKLVNLGLHICPVFDKSDTEILNDNIFVNTHTKKNKCIDLLKKYIEDITIVDNDYNVVVLFHTKKAFDRFVTYCKEYSQSLDERDVKLVDIDDMLMDVDYRNKRYELRLYKYQINYLVPEIFSFQESK